MANQEACQKTLDYLLAHPEVHDQHTYMGVNPDRKSEINICGTQMCVAGAAVLVNYNLQVGPRGGLKYPSGRYFYHDDLWSELGRQVLGLTEKQANLLFHHIMDNDRALKLLKEYANGER